MSDIKVSIITAVFNGEEFLEDTIQSIVCQDYPDFEYIIIDGGSTDKTLEIIKKYEDKITHWISEPDKGISDAFNKGMRLAKGNYINFQGDGDRLFENTTLRSVFQNVNESEDDLVSCLIERVDWNGEHKFISKDHSPIKREQLLHRLTVPHQGLFTHRRFYEKFGFFDVSNVFCMDYELLLRSYHDFPMVKSLPIVASKWRDDGIGNQRELEIYREYHRIKLENSVSSRLHLELINLWVYAKYYIKKFIGIYKKY